MIGQTPLRLEDYPPDARWIQTTRGTVIVCKDGTVYLNAMGRTVELQPPGQDSSVDNLAPASTL